MIRLIQISNPEANSNDRKVDSSCVWSVNPSPDDENIIVVTLGSGGVQLLKFNPPGHRVMIGSDGINVGTPGEMLV